MVGAADKVVSSEVGNGRIGRNGRNSENGKVGRKWRSRKEMKSIENDGFGYGLELW